jgi:hypothetical protein
MLRRLTRSDDLDQESAVAGIEGVVDVVKDRDRTAAPARPSFTSADDNHSSGTTYGKG